MGRFFCLCAAFLLVGCGAQPGTNLGNAGVTVPNANTNANIAAGNTTSSNSAATVIVESREPAQYQAKVDLKLEAIGGEQKTAMPALTATVARSGDDRRMEFTMPAGGRIVFLDKGGKNYLIMPDRKQYAELTRESLGFEVRRMMMPEQIVDQVKSVPGLVRVGEEKYNGRDAVKYRYAAVADTQTRAGQVATESFLLVDKQTGLPLRSETVSQTQTGANVQGYTGLRIVTEIGDIKTETPADLFAEPTAFQKIESDQVRAQVDMVFNSVAMMLGQLIRQAQTAAPAR
jgi:hypothetical protein